MHYGSIGPPPWDDRPVFLIGGGPSLRGFDLSRLPHARAHIVGINQAMIHAPCSAGVTGDNKFIDNRRAELAAIAARMPLFVCCNLKTDPVPGAINLVRHYRGGLSTDPKYVHSGGSSGYAALNVATLKGARDIILLGFDYGGAPDGRQHWHDAYPWFEPHTGWASWARSYGSTVAQLREAGVRVRNASPASAITAFEKTTIEEAVS